MNKPKEPIRVLFVEDSADDVALIERELDKAGYQPEVERVEDLPGLEQAIERGPWDLILSDFNMPRFTGAEALRHVRRAGLDVPFIIVSGSIGEEIAVEAMKAGAQDYFRKDNTRRLGAAIRRELLDSAVRRERSVAIEALRHAEERYRLIVENIRDHAIFMLDGAAKIASWSGGAERVTGFAAKEIIGEAYGALFTPEERASGVPERDLARVQAEGELESEGFRVKKNGARFWASSSVNAIQGGAEMRGYSVVLRDSTNRKEIVDGLRLAVQARDEFLSIASHELKTPLASVVLQLGAAEKLVTAGNEMVPSAILSPKLKVLARQVDRLLVLVDNLLDVTRITAGRLDLSKSRVDYREVVRAVLGRMREAIERSGSEVALRAPSPVLGLCDPVRLDTVIVNLVSNALKYGRAEPISVEVRADGDHARIVVTDRGIGIRTSDIERIFERFERAVPVQHYGGFGIGLWVVRQIVEAHGGRIAVLSEEARGSTFTVDIPFSGEKSPPESPGL